MNNINSAEGASRTEPIGPSTPSRRRKVFRAASVVLGLAIAGGLGEVAARIYFHKSGKHLETLRQVLAGEALRESRIQKQPYLLYTPTPGYKSGENFHNDAGFRGKAVPLERTEGTLRILCLGGSTTYGTAVENPNDAYPAQLKRILNSTRPEKSQPVEVINAGLEYATTAELLTHYHFKYHYYRPDLVIINTGGNDALPASSPNYQPDYSHWREQPAIPRPLSSWGRALMKSRLAALGIIGLMYSGDEADFRLDRASEFPPADWYRGGENPADPNPAFLHNLRSLVAEIERGGGRVLLVPYRLADDYDVPEEAYVRANEAALKRLAEEKNLPLAPFPAGVITPENWADGSHLNKAGCQEKAAHIAEHAGPLLWKKPSR